MSSKKSLRSVRAKRILALCSALAVTAGIFASSPMPQAVAEDVPVWQDASGKYTFDERAADLVSRMTVEEKAKQLDDKPPAIDRPGLQLAGYDYWNEALHGVVASGTTMFPSATSIASTWNRGLVSTLGNVIGDEARALNNRDGKGLTYWSPTLNIYRDPRWGRADESYSEDPYLVGQIGEQFIKGVQGNDPKYLKAISTPKHFFANNSESNRRNGNSVVTERELREYYTPAFAHALSPEVGAGSYMTAYNRVNGVPMSASTEYLQDLVVRTWGFNGYVTSDCSAVQDAYNRHKWVPEGWDHAVDKFEAVAWTIKAGTDIDCQGNDYEQFMVDSYNKGYVTDADLDSELTKLLAGRFKLGEFDPASKVSYRGSEYSVWSMLSNAEHQAASLAVSQEAPVLLKNDYIGGNTGGSRRGLPLTKQDAEGGIAVVGYLAENFVEGGYSGSNPVDQRTFMQGVQQVAKEISPTASVNYIGPGVKPGGVTRGYAPFDLSSWFGLPPGTMVIPWSTSVADGKPGVQSVQLLSNTATTPTTVKEIKAVDSGNGYPLSLTNNPAPDQFTIWEGWMGINWGYSDYMRSSSVWGGYFTVRADIASAVDGVCLQQSGSQQAVYPTEAMTPGSEIWVESAPKGAFFDVHLDAADGPVVARVPADGDTAACGKPGASITLDKTKAPGGQLSGVHDLYFQYNFGSLGDENSANPADHQGQPGHPYAYSMDAAQKAQIAAASAVVVVVGTTNAEASEEMDRVNIDLPRFQDEVVSKVAALNPHTVVWMQSVGQMNIEEFDADSRVPSIVWTNYNGQHQGITAGDILFGKVNPSGKLPMTWYSDIDEMGVGSIWDYQITPDATHKGRTYEYFNGSVSYPFGHGLSYSNFQYSNLRINKASLTGDDTLTAQVDVTNSSNIPGKETVQLYVTAPGADGVDRPKRQLKGFDKVSLGAYDTKTVTISVKASDLWFWDDVNNKTVWDKGVWRLQVGAKAGSGPYTSFNLTADPTPSLDVVAAIPDGTVLNTASPNSVIHSNPSATRNDQSFLDLNSPAVDVKYTSKNPAVAKVDADGIVSPVGVGVTSITLSVTALGSTKSFTYPVVVEGDDADPVVDFADKKVELSAAGSVQLSAKVALAPANATTAVKYYIQGMDENTAGASVNETTGLLTATKAGKVRVTALADVDGVKVSQAAEVTVVPNGGLTPQPAALNAAIAAAEALAATATADSAAATGLTAAIAAAKAAVVAATSQKDLDRALEALNAAVAAASGSLTIKDSASSRAALVSVLQNAVTSASGIAAAGFTPASYAALNAAIANAKQVAANPNASLDQLQAAVSAVLSAVANLKSANATAPAPKVTTKSVTVKGAAFKKNSKPKVSVSVKLSSGTAKGRVTVYVGAKAVKTVNVSKATTSITLPAKYKKAISVKAAYKPAKANVNGTAKTSAVVKVKVKK